MMYWFTEDWWNYLLAAKNRYCHWPKVVWCRVRGHKAGVRWYNADGYEPDMRCRRLMETI